MKKKCKECGEILFNRYKHAEYCKDCQYERNMASSKKSGNKKKLILKLLRKKYKVKSLDEIIDKLKRGG